MSCFKRCRGLCSAVGMLLTTVVDKGVLLLRVQMRCVSMPILLIRISVGQLLHQTVARMMIYDISPSPAVFVWVHSVIMFCLRLLCLAAPYLGVICPGVL